MRKFIIAIAVLFTCGCTPYMPQKYITIKTNEEAFLLPLVSDSQKQESTNNEEYLKNNLVFTRQVQIPQRWRKTGYTYLSGEWVDSAALVVIDKSPITREWTADSNSGTSNKNEAVWVMTSDQVEFSTGWI